MKTLNRLTSACRYCRYYKLEGRRGGTCEMLGGSVQGSWKACALALPAFAPSWEGLEEIMLLADKTPVLSNVRTLCGLENYEIKPTEQSDSTSEQRKTLSLAGGVIN